MLDLFRHSQVSTVHRKRQLMGISPCAVDWSSAHVFGGVGEVSVTAQIFPSDDTVDAYLFSTGGSTGNVELTVHHVESV